MLVYLHTCAPVHTPRMANYTPAHCMECPRIYLLCQSNGVPDSWYHEMMYHMPSGHMWCRRCSLDWVQMIFKPTAVHCGEPGSQSFGEVECNLGEKSIQAMREYSGKAFTWSRAPLGMAGPRPFYFLLTCSSRTQYVLELAANLNLLPIRSCFGLFAFTHTPSIFVP